MQDLRHTAGRPFLRGLLAAAIGICSTFAGAAAPDVSGVFAMRLENSANSANRATGEILFWGANDVIPTTSFGFTRQCPLGSTCSSPSDPDLVRQALFHRPFELRPNQYFASRPYDERLISSWRLLTSSDPAFPIDPNRSTFVDTPPVGTVHQMPFVKSMTASGAGLTPRISWELPDTLPVGLTVDSARVFILDNSHPVTVTSRSPTLVSSFLQSDLIFSSDRLPATQTSFDVPSSWTTPSGTRSLEFGTQYSIGVVLTHHRLGEPLDSAALDLSRSQSYFDFTPIDLPGVSDIHLPRSVPVATTSGIVAGPPYEFNVASVSPNQVTFIDPFVATGFTYVKGATDPNFKSVKIATRAGDGLYNILVWNGSDWQLVRSGLGVDETFDFVTDGQDVDGVERFQVTGIEESAGLSPFDVTALVTGLTFMREGSFTGTMQAIGVVEIEQVPEPATLALAALGIAGLAWSGRRRGSPSRRDC